MNLNLIVLRCSDIDAAKRFYETLGMRFERHAHGSGPEHYAHEDAHGVFELYPAQDGAPDRTGLGFVSDGLEQTRASFVSAQFEPGPIRETPWGVSFVIRDPDGRRIEISKK